MNSKIIDVYSEKEAEEDLNNLFSEMTEGYKVQIRRIEPEWCDGLLGTFEWDASEPISMDWVERKFGGRKLKITILGIKNEYRRTRTIKLASEPRRDGKPLIQGDHGYPILADSPEARRMHIAEPQSSQNQNQGQNGVLDAMKSFFELQATQNATIQNTLVARVQHLETLLTQKVTEPQAQVQTSQPGQPGQPFYDPTQQLRTTLETMKMIDELRDSVRQGDTDETGELWDKVIDKVVNKFMDEKPKQAAQQPSPQAGQLPAPQKPPLSDLELMAAVKNRLDKMPEQKRDELIEQFMGDYYDDDDDDTGQPETEPIKSDLLTEEDKNELNEQENASGASNEPAVVPTDESPSGQY